MSMFVALGFESYSVLLLLLLQRLLLFLLLLLLLLLLRLRQASDRHEQSCQEMTVNMITSSVHFAV